MNLLSLPVSIVILIITAYLCVYIYRKDKIEKEPLPLLALLFVAGAIIFVLTAFLEEVCVGRIDTAFLPYNYFDTSGTRYFDTLGIRLMHTVACALTVALIEEVLRGLLLILLTHKNKNFNYTFDGIVYAVILYLGFGMMEAFRYVGSGGMGSVLMRAICCIPGQLFLGVIMGCCYTRWHRKKAVVPLFLIIPVLVHTVYSFISLNSTYSNGHMYELAIVLMFIIAVIIIRRSASKDQLIAAFLCIALVSSMTVPMDVSAASKTSTKNSGGYYYKQLTETGSRIYDDMKTAIKNGNEPTSRGHESTLDFAPSVTALTNEHPEYYWLRCGYGYSYYFDNFKIKYAVTCTNYSYWDQMLNKEANKKKLNDAVNKIVKKAKKKKSKYEQIKYVHDYITNNCIYDYDRYDACKRTIHDPFDEQIYSAYGCLVQKKAVCAGYAQAFQLILNKLGIPCTYITGWGTNLSGHTERHAWNCVTLGGKRYLVDVTWDDYDIEGKNNDATHTYFMVTSKFMDKDHTATDDFGYLKAPKASGTKYNYFKKQKYTIKKYSSNTLDNKLYKQRKKAMKEVHFTTKKQYKRALKAIKNGSFQGYKTFKYEGFRYYWDDLHHNIIFTKR